MRPRVRDDIASHRGLPTPRVNAAALVVATVAIMLARMVAEVAAKKQRSPRKPTLLSIAKQAKKAGIDVARYEIEPSGKIVVVPSKGDSAGVEANNPWDTVLSGDAEHAPKQKRAP